MFGLGKFQEAQEKLQEVKSRLELVEITGESGNGAITVRVTGSRKIKDIQIQDHLLGADNRQELQQLVVAAVNQAMEQAETMSKSEMEAAARDLLPGFGGMLSGLFGK